MEPKERLHFRDARKEDQPAIAAMTSDIWDGHDYLAQVWEEWLEEPNSLLRVGTLGEEIVATGRVVELSPGEWWLEGLRVLPAQQGKGLASRLHDHLVGLVEAQPGVQRFGLATSWKTSSVAHMARRSGMGLRAEYRFLKGPALTEAVGEVQRVPSPDPSILLERLQTSRWLQKSGGYVMDGWVARRVNKGWLEEIIEAGGVWQCGDAIALADDGTRGDEPWLYLLAGGTSAEQEALVRHVRHLAHLQAPTAFMRCFVPVDETLYRPLLVAGLQDPYKDGEFRIRHFVREFGRAS